jgi:hypothetical protein
LSAGRRCRELRRSDHHSAQDIAGPEETPGWVTIRPPLHFGSIIYLMRNTERAWSGSEGPGCAILRQTDKRDRCERFDRRHRARTGKSMGHPPPDPGARTPGRRCPGWLRTAHVVLLRAWSARLRDEDGGRERCDYAASSASRHHPPRPGIGPPGSSAPTEHVLGYTVRQLIKRPCDRGLTGLPWPRRWTRQGLAAPGGPGCDDFCPRSTKLPYPATTSPLAA